jgi:hypothetical protein
VSLRPQVLVCLADLALPIGVGVVVAQIESAEIDGYFLLSLVSPKQDPMRHVRPRYGDSSAQS